MFDGGEELIRGEEDVAESLVGVGRVAWRVQFPEVREGELDGWEVWLVEEGAREVAFGEDVLGVGGGELVKDREGARGVWGFE